MKVYISGFSNQEENREILSVPLSSSVVLFVLNYCKTADFHVVFVEDSCLEGKWNQMNIECLQNIPYDFIRPQDVPTRISNCSLPVCEDERDLMVRCGLCCVVRHIIKVTDAKKAEEHLIDLLGFRTASLKACAEVSGWTKLCEVELPSSVSGLIQKFREETEAVSVEIPEDLMKLELHFDQPPLLHNDDKPKRIILRNIQTDFQNNEEQIKGEQVVIDKFFADREEDMPHGKVRYRVISPEEREARKYTNTENGEKCKFGCTENRLVKWCAKCNDREKLKRKKEIQNRNYARLLNKTLTDCDSDTCIETSKTSVVENGVEHKDTRNTIKNIDELCDYVATLTLHDIVYDHLFTEGVYFTIADVVLFVYIYHLAESLQACLSDLLYKLPNIRKWLSDVLTLQRLQNTSTSYGFDLELLRQAVKNSRDNSSGPTFTIPVAPLVVEEKGNEISRGSKAKQKALRKDLAKLLERLEEQNITPSVGQHPCGENVHIDWKSVPLAAHPKVELPEKRVGRKCEQLENLATAICSIAKPGDVIVDFCSGAGHIGILIAYLLPDCKVYLIENKEESLTRAKGRADELGLDNVVLYQVNLVENNEESLLRASRRMKALGLSNVCVFQCNLDYFKGQFDIGVCLHACGVATDLVLQQCLDRKAAFVICPCCYGNIQNTHLLTYPRSQFYKDAGLSEKDMITLGHAADMTEENIDLQQKGRYCMNLVDLDRAKLAEENGYTVTLCSLQPLSCTPKNNLLIGTLTR